VQYTGKSSLGPEDRDETCVLLDDDSSCGDRIRGHCVAGQSPNKNWQEIAATVAILDHISGWMQRTTVTQRPWRGCSRTTCGDPPRRNIVKQAAADRSDRGIPSVLTWSSTRTIFRRYASPDVAVLTDHNHNSRVQRWRKLRRQATRDSGICEAKPLEGRGGGIARMSPE